MLQENKKIAPRRRPPSPLKKIRPPDEIESLAFEIVIKKGQILKTKP